MAAIAPDVKIMTSKTTAIVALTNRLMEQPMFRELAWSISRTHVVVVGLSTRILPTDFLLSALLDVLVLFFCLVDVLVEEIGWGSRLLYSYVMVSRAPTRLRVSSTCRLRDCSRKNRGPKQRLHVLRKRPSPRFNLFFFEKSWPTIQSNLIKRRSEQVGPADLWQFLARAVQAHHLARRREREREVERLRSAAAAGGEGDSLHALGSSIRVRA